MQPEGGTGQRPSSRSTNVLVPHYGPDQIGVLSWNVGGISDHRKDQGAGLEEVGSQSLPWKFLLSTRDGQEAQAAVADVLQAAAVDLAA